MEPGRPAIRRGSVGILACEAGNVAITALGRDVFGNDCASVPPAVGAALLPGEAAAEAALSAALRPKVRLGSTNPNPNPNPNPYPDPNPNRPKGRAAGTRSQQLAPAEGEEEEEEDDDDDEDEEAPRRKGGAARACISLISP